LFGQIFVYHAKFGMTLICVAQKEHTPGSRHVGAHVGCARTALAMAASYYSYKTREPLEPRYTPPPLTISCIYRVFVVAARTFAGIELPGGGVGKAKTILGGKASTLLRPGDEWDGKIKSLDPLFDHGIMADMDNPPDAERQTMQKILINRKGLYKTKNTRACTSILDSPLPFAPRPSAHSPPPTLHPTNLPV
jgi:hypothetical protein